MFDKLRRIAERFNLREGKENGVGDYNNASSYSASR